MFILKGLLILFLFVLLLGFFASLWLKYTFRKMHKNMNRMHGKDENGDKIPRQKQSKQKPRVENKGDYVDFEEIEN